MHISVVETIGTVLIRDVFLFQGSIEREFHYAHTYVRTPVKLSCGMLVVILPP